MNAKHDLTAEASGGRASPVDMVARLRTLAATRPSDTALVTATADGDRYWNYASLERRVRALAAGLQARCSPGERALLLLDNDEHYVTAFFACLYAGVVAVPMFRPDAGKQHHVARLRTVAGDAEAACWLTSGTGVDVIHQRRAELDAGDVLAVDDVDEASASRWQEHGPSGEDIAFLQYTSGSTSSPKGVMVSHGNLMANERAIETSLKTGPDDVFVSWLPLYHDMGLIGGLVQPFYRGIPLVLMSPEFFLQRPVRWLEAITRHRGTISGGPDFAYRLCLERVRDRHREALDLSSWRVAFSGAEPVRNDTLQGFIDRFAPVGFNADAPHPSYGLAEATLLVTGERPQRGFVSEAFSPEALARGHAQPDAEGRRLVGCGHAPPEHRVVIVDTRTLECLPEGRIGEIWAGGPSIAQGYWQRPEATGATFVHREGERWLRTGDVGFLHRGELYIAGRIKDLIILRGQNVYPQDIETAIESSVAAVRPGRVAAFAVPNAAGEEAVGVAVEVSRPTQKRVPPETLVEALNRAVAAACGESVAVAVLLDPGALPKTSSGKLQRSACRQGWQENGLDAYAVYEHGRFVAGGTAPAAGVTPVDDLEADLLALWCEVLRCDQTQVPGRDAHFFASGGNSIAAAQLAARIGERWGIEFALRTVFERPRLNEIAQAIRWRLADASYAGDDGARQPPEKLAAVPRDQTLPLAPAQRRLWLVDRFAGAAGATERAAYNLSAAFALTGRLDVDVLGETLDAIVARHEILRTRYPQNEAGEPIAVIDGEHRSALSVVDVRDRPDDERERRLDELRRDCADTPFDLGHGPLMRATLARLSEESHVLILAVHHIVFDGWSTGVFVRDFARLYDAFAHEREAALPPLPIQYVDYACWHQRLLVGGAFEGGAAFWRRYLDGAPRLSTVAPDFERPATASHAGEALRLTLDGELASTLSRLAGDRGATLFTVLLASFQLLLHRSTGQSDLVVGTDVAGRVHPDLENLIGFFVNVLPLRSRLDDGSTAFSDWLDRGQADVLGAFEHQQIPFDQIVESTGTPRRRSHNPLVQVLFVLQNTPSESFALPGLDVEVLPQSRNESKFDLAVFVTEEGGGLDVEWVYASALYRRTTMKRLASAWHELLRQIAHSPEKAIEGFRIPPMQEPDAMHKSPSKRSKLDKLNSLSARSKAQKPSVQEPVRARPLDAARKLPVVLEALDPDLDPVAWARSHRDDIERRLYEHAGILFRNFSLKTPQAFEAFAEAIEPGLYGGYGDLPKKAGGRNTYHSTPYPQQKMILYHNESAHLERWPTRQLFYCEQPAPVGGATPIVDCREVLGRLPAEIRETFERKGLLYVRTFTRNLDVSWRDFFGTDSREAVEERLAKAGIAWEWLGEEELQTRTHCPAVITHPVTGERVFFNQVQLHHASCLEPDVREGLLSIVGSDRLPRNVYYGDGTPIEDEVMAVVGRAYEASAVRFDWQQGDVVMLENMLAAHARDPYEGPRKIVVAMGAMFERCDLDAPEASGAAMATSDH
ncbi:condensation domain-containing protein [Arhodomonas sp. AD133]|uniref:TauD/TfdA family dioxygenase n=1 Tax=Arhodomonas sp. AD133 TaxID=3415009 RepID=UPI003EBC0221